MADVKGTYLIFTSCIAYLAMIILVLVAHVNSTIATNYVHRTYVMVVQSLCTVQQHINFGRCAFRVLLQSNTSSVSLYFYNSTIRRRSYRYVHIGRMILHYN